MDIVKKNVFSIIFGVVCLLAVISLYYPIDGMYASLSSMLDTRAAKASDIQSIIDSPRKIPPMSPDEGAQPLTVFPIPDVTNNAIKSVKAVHDQADAMMQSAVKVSHGHQLLVQNCLPNPDHDTAFKFSVEYMAQTANAKHWMDMLNATSLPSQDQIVDAKKKLKDKITSDHGFAGDVKPTANDQRQMDEEYKSQEPGVPASLQAEFAQNFSMYVPPDTLTYNRGVIDPSKDAPATAAQIWDAQLSFWILDDICAALNHCNLKSSNADTRPSNLTTVQTSPIKRIYKMTPPTLIAGDINAGSNGAVINASYGTSPSGRVSNGIYDAYSFQMDLIVDAAKLQMIIDKLEEGRFLTVNNVQIEETVDLATEQKNGYFYGQRTCVRVAMDCEMLEMRAAFSDFLPDARKNGQTGTLAQAAPGAPATPASGATGAPAGPGGPPGQTGAPPPGMFHPPGAPPGVFVPIPTQDNNDQ
jgi:hypothetical protein